MLINKDSKPLLSDLYEYDFSACFYSILKNIGYDLSNINFENKLTRNIQLGLLQKENPRLAIYLNSSTAALIDHYLCINNIMDDQIIWRQKDGIILLNQLKNTNSTLPIEFRGNISKLISSLKKDKIILLYSNGNVIPKGITNKTLDMSFYNLFSHLNFSNKRLLSSGLEDIRNTIFTSTNINWFVREVNGEYFVPIINRGNLKFHRSSLESIIPKDIDKSILWNNYLWPFCQTILVFCNE